MPCWSIGDPKVCSCLGWWRSSCHKAVQDQLFVPPKDWASPSSKEKQQREPATPSTAVRTRYCREFADGSPLATPFPADMVMIRLARWPYRASQQRAALIARVERLQKALCLWRIECQAHQLVILGSYMGYHRRARVAWDAWDSPLTRHSSLPAH